MIELIMFLNTSGIEIKPENGRKLASVGEMIKVNYVLRISQIITLKTIVPNDIYPDPLTTF